MTNIKYELKGCHTSPKRMNFRKSSERGGGSFSIQKFTLQIFAIIDNISVMNFRKKSQYNFPKMSGGGGGGCFLLIFFGWNINKYNNDKYNFTNTFIFPSNDE